MTLATGRRIDTATVVWAAGVTAHPLARAWGLPLDELGRVVVDSSLRVPGRPDIWALGDCAAVPNAATPGRFDPPTCQHAVRQARALVGSIAGDTRPYRYRSIGEGATLGRGRGIARVFGLHVRGRLGALITRATTSVRCPCARGGCASSPTACCRRCSAATSPSSALSGRRRAREVQGPVRRA